MKILVVSPHPDDEVLGCGGVMKKYAEEGHEVYVLLLTDGSEIRYGDSMIEGLQKEARACGKILGVKEIFFRNLPEQKLDGIPLLDIIREVEAVVEKVKPEIVYTPHQGDINQDHGAVFEATMIAIRAINKDVKEIYSYETPSSTEWGVPRADRAFIPNVFVNIENQLEHKIKALNEYKSQIKKWPHSRSNEGVRTVAQYRGMQSHLPAAEAFMLMRKIERK